MPRHEFAPTEGSTMSAVPCKRCGALAYGLIWVPPNGVAKVWLAMRNVRAEFVVPSRVRCKPLAPKKVV